MSDPANDRAEVVRADEIEVLHREPAHVDCPDPRQGASRGFLVLLVLLGIAVNTIVLRAVWPLLVGVWNG